VKIIQNYLWQKNTRPYQNTTVGKALQNKDIKELWQERKSPVDTLIIHAMSAVHTAPGSPHDPDELISLFLFYEVSAHYLILRTGEIYHLVPEEKKAWHCGKSQMPPPDNRTGVNDFSIGIELAGGNYPFTEAQYASLSPLVQDLQNRHRITRILGHEDVAGKKAVDEGLRSDIKTDPGQFFSWDRLREQNPPTSFS
jgi:N-acetyl-anhydromuramyl-L-alanine amidase AmpD